jgi:hypothetical protein
MELGLSKERVRQLEVRALAQLKAMLQPLRDHRDLTLSGTSFFTRSTGEFP